MRQRLAPVFLVPVLLAALVLTACAADEDAFYPETGSADRVLEQRALARVPPAYKPVSVSVIKQWGPLGIGGDTEIIGYNAWIRIEGCSGHVLVRFNRWGDHRATADLTNCG